MSQERARSSQIFEKMKQLKGEIRFLEGEGDTLWKQKCLDLFKLCHTLKEENSQIQESFDSLVKQTNSYLEQQKDLPPLTNNHTCAAAKGLTAPTSMDHRGGQDRKSKSSLGFSGATQRDFNPLTPGQNIRDIRHILNSNMRRTVGGHR